MEWTIVEIDGKEYYTFAPEYFENERVAELSGYYWDDEIGKWTKEIVSDQTTVF